MTTMGIAVVGAGYWGPNLVRNLTEARTGICAGSATSTLSAPPEPPVTAATFAAPAT